MGIRLDAELPPMSHDIESVDPNDLVIEPPHLLSKIERVNYYHGLGRKPPQLYYRSDHESNPYPLPSPGTPFRLPIKWHDGDISDAFSSIWYGRMVFDKVIALLRELRIIIVTLSVERFSSHYEGGPKTLGPIVIWISTRPNTTSPATARDISDDILYILEKHGVTGVAVEWYESTSRFLML